MARLSDGIPASYRESHSLVPALAAWPLLVCALYTTGEVAWTWTHGQHGQILSLPGALGFLAIGLGAVVARQYVEVTPQHVLVGHSARLCRRIGVIELQRVEAREHAPSRWQPKWPFSNLRVYSMDWGPGVLLTLSSGERIFIGAREPKALVRAISSAAPHVLTAGV